MGELRLVRAVCGFFTLPIRVGSQGSREGRSARFGLVVNDTQFEYMNDGSAATFPTALLVERRCSMNGSGHVQAGQNGKGYSSLREVLIRIPAETQGAVFLFIRLSPRTAVRCAGEKQMSNVHLCCEYVC